MTVSTILGQEAWKGSILWDSLIYTVHSFAMLEFVLTALWKFGPLKIIYMRARSKNGFKSWYCDICEYKVRLYIRCRCHHNSQFTQLSEQHSYVCFCHFLMDSQWIQSVGYINHITSFLKVFQSILFYNCWKCLKSWCRGK